MLTDRYYRHSGRFSPAAVAKALGVGLLASIPMAFVYSYVIVYIPIIGTITFILTAGFGAVVGFAAGHMLHAGKVRNNAVAMATGLAVGLFALWASWVTWVYAILRQSDVKLGLFDLALNPAALWELIHLINEKGAWSFKGLTPTGGLLWVFWACEAVIIVGLVMAVAQGYVSSPFCEGCDRWCEQQKDFAVVAATRAADLTPRLEQRDFTILRELSDTTGSSFTRLDLHQCSQCQTTISLSATSVTITMKSGKQAKDETVLLRDILLSPPDLVTVKAMIAEGQATAKARPAA